MIHFHILASNLFPLGSTCSRWKPLKHSSLPFVKRLFFRVWESGKTTRQTMQKLPKPPPYYLIFGKRISFFIYTHIHIILQRIWVSTEAKNHFFRTVPISSHKWLSSRALNFSF